MVTYPCNVSEFEWIDVSQMTDSLRVKRWICRTSKRTPKLIRLQSMMRSYRVETKPLIEVFSCISSGSYESSELFTHPPRLLAEC